MAPDLGSWWADVAIPVWRSHSLPGSRLSASLLRDTHQLSSGVFLARNFHASLQTQLCRPEFPQREERTAVSGVQKLPLPSLGAFLSLSRAWFVEGLRFPPDGDTDDWLCCHFSTHGIPCSRRERAVEPLAGSQHQLVHCLLYCASVLLQISP